MNLMQSEEKIIEISDLRRRRIENSFNSNEFSVSYETTPSARLESENDSSSMYGGGSGGGNMNERLARLEAIEAINSRLLAEIKQDISNTNNTIGLLERRVIDKVDDNQKWVIALIISSILVPILLALVAK